MPRRSHKNRLVSPRLAVAAIASGAVAFACGRNTKPEHVGASPLVTVAAPSENASVVSLAGAPRGRPAPAVEGTFTLASDARGIEFRLAVTNGTKKSVELTFLDGQTHEFVVLDSIGREVWRWSKGRLFTQNVQTRLLSGGDGFTVAERWESPGPSGSYVAVARLRSRAHPIEQRVAFRIP